MDKIRKVLACEIKQVGEEADRVLRFTGSDETPDRENDIIEVAGWKLDNYQKNPVFLWAHNYDEPPIGKAVNVSKDLASRRLVFDIKFPTLDEYPFADTIYKLFKGGYLSATSVGFRGIKSKARDEDAVLEKPEWQRGRRYMEQELLELSAVPVPCNPNALMAVRGKGFKDEDIEQVFVEEKAEGCPHTCCLMCKTPCDKKMECCSGCMMCCQEICEDCEKDCKMACCDMCKAMCQTMCAGCCKTDCTMHQEMANMEPPPKAFQRKSGATLSAKNRALLTTVHDGVERCRKDLKDFLDAAMPMDTANMTAQMTGPMMMPMEPMSAMRTVPNLETTVKIELSEEFKQALEDLKTQVLLLTPKDASRVDIDLAAIEFPKAQSNAADIELNIEPGELKNMIDQAIDKRIQGGM